MGETSARVKELYTEGGPEADESTNIFFVSVISNFFGAGTRYKVNFSMLS